MLPRVTSVETQLYASALPIEEYTVDKRCCIARMFASSVDVPVTAVSVQVERMDNTNHLPAQREIAQRIQTIVGHQMAGEDQSSIWSDACLHLTTYSPLKRDLQWLKKKLELPASHGTSSARPARRSFVSRSLPDVRMLVATNEERERLLKIADITSKLEQFLEGMDEALLPERSDTIQRAKELLRSAPSRNTQTTVSPQPHVFGAGQTVARLRQHLIPWRGGVVRVMETRTKHLKEILCTAQARLKLSMVMKEVRACKEECDQIDRTTVCIVIQCHVSSFSLAPLTPSGLEERAKLISQQKCPGAVKTIFEDMQLLDQGSLTKINFGAPFLPRQQDLLPAAFVSPDDAASLLECGARKVDVLSYGWRMGGNPDPDCKTPAAILQYYKFERDGDERDGGLFWDR